MKANITDGLKLSKREQVRATFALHGGEMSIEMLQWHLANDGISVSESTCRRALNELDANGLPFAKRLRRRRLF